MNVKPDMKVNAISNPISAEASDFKDFIIDLILQTEIIIKWTRIVIFVVL